MLERSLLAAGGTPQLVVTLVVLLAAVLHATWNAMVKGISDQVVAFSLLDAASFVVCAVGLPFVAGPARAAWPFLAGSVVTHVGYKVLLMNAYREGDLGQVYPIARGVSPLAVAAFSAVVLGEHLDRWQLAGVLVISLGLISLAFTAGGAATHGRPLGFALGTGLLIATYTILDGVGVRHAGAPLGYALWLFTLQGLPIPVGAAAVRGRRLLLQVRPYLTLGLAAGVISVIAYTLILWAQLHADLAIVAALRETGVVVAAGIGAVLFHERFGPRRVAAAVLVAGGIALLTLA